MKKVFKLSLILIVIVLTITLTFWVSGATFMYLFHLPVEQSRPWSIIQYWQLYGHASEKTLRISSTLCLFLPWIVMAVVLLKVFEKKPKALHGAARFANLSEIRKSGLLDPKDGFDRTILVGKVNHQYLCYGGKQFVILAAPTRSGKGVGVVIPNCLNYSESLVVLDIKGENFDVTSGFRAKSGQDVYLFAPFEDNGITHRYNPLEYISDDPFSRINDIDSIATALYAGDNQNDKFWSENAKVLFRGICLYVLETPGLPKTLGEILRQASKGQSIKKYFLEQLSNAQENGHPYSSACADSLNRILQNSDNTLSGIVSTFQTPLGGFQNPRVDLATSANDFDLREVRRRKISIYFKISPDKLEDSSSKILVKLFFNQLLNLNTRTLPSQDPTLKYQCLVLMDEATAIGGVPIIKQSVSYMAGYNMRLLTVIQNKSQLEDAYGKAGALTILSNHALMIMYTPSPTTLNDAKEYSEMLGYETVKATSMNKGKGSKSESISDQRRALMLPQELLELSSDKAIVRLEHTKAILCDRIRYYEDSNFKDRAFIQPPLIPQQNVENFLAKIEQHIRSVTDADIQDPNMTSKIVGGDFVSPIDEIPRDRIEEFINQNPDIIETTLNQVFENVIKTHPIDVSKIKNEKSADLSELKSEGPLDEDQIDDAFDQMFTEGSSEDFDNTSTETNSNESGNYKIQQLYDRLNSARKTQPNSFSSTVN